MFENAVYIACMAKYWFFDIFMKNYSGTLIERFIVVLDTIYQGPMRFVSINTTGPKGCSLISFCSSLHNILYSTDNLILPALTLFFLHLAPRGSA